MILRAAFSRNRGGFFLADGSAAVQHGSLRKKLGLILKSSPRIRINKSSPFFTCAFLRGKVIIIIIIIIWSMQVHMYSVHCEYVLCTKKPKKNNVLFLDVSTMPDAFSEG